MTRFYLRCTLKPNKKDNQKLAEGFTDDVSTFLEKEYLTGKNRMNRLDVSLAEKGSVTFVADQHAVIADKIHKHQSIFSKLNPFASKRKDDNSFVVKVDIPFLKNPKLDDEFYTELTKQLHERNSQIEEIIYVPFNEVITPYSAYNTENKVALNERYQTSESTSLPTGKTKSKPSAEDRTSRSRSSTDSDTDSESSLLDTVIDIKNTLHNMQHPDSPTSTNTSSSGNSTPKSKH